MRLKYFFIVILICVTVIPLFLSLYYLNRYTNEQFRHQIEEKLEVISLTAKKRIISIIERVRDSTALVASRTQMRLSLAEWNRTRSPERLNMVQRIINDAEAGVTRLYAITIYDTNGVPVASTKDALTTEKLDIQDKNAPEISLARESDQLLLIYTQRLIIDNDIVGYIRTALLGDFLLDTVYDRAGLGETGEWLFAIRHESGDAMFAVPLKYDNNAAFNRRVQHDRKDVPIIQAFLGNEIVMRNAPDYREIPVVASTRYIKELDLGLVVKMDEKEVSEMIRNFNLVVYSLEAIVIILAVIIGFISFYILIPLEKLKQATAMAAHGELTGQIEQDGTSDVSELAKNFNIMMNNIKDLNNNLDQKVLDRTQELDVINKELQETATRDYLTGLYNRRYLEDWLHKESIRTKRYGGILGIVLLDIDHFKKVNDTWGHITGDEVLKGLATYLKNALRESDTLARIGGEEFCIVFPNINPESIMAFLNRIREEIAKLNFEANGEKFNITCSFGVAYLDKNNTDAMDVIIRADTALYQAKRTGRNKVVEYSDDIPVNKVVHLSTKK